MRSQFSFNFARGIPTSLPRLPQDGYPFDLDGALDFTRPATGWTLWPNNATYPNNLGQLAVSGLMPQQDAAVYAQMIARLPWGPTVNAVPEDPTKYIIQAIFPTLPQVGSYDSMSGGR